MNPLWRFGTPCRGERLPISETIRSYETQADVASARIESRFLATLKPENRSR